MKKVFSVGLLAAVLLLFLNGCVYYSAGVENALLTPPKLTDGQNEIYDALVKQVGTGISLRYPKTGNYRSAFVIENIDTEPGKEALVFYQSNVNVNATAALTVSILDQRDGEWISTYDIAGEGSDIDQVDFSTFGTADNMFIIIGYAMTNENDKVLHIYNYNDGKIKDLFSYPYSMMQVADIDNDGYQEIVALNSRSAGNTAKADVIKYRQGIFEVVDSVNTDNDVTSYVNVQTGFIGNNQSALYLDGIKGQNKISTQILYYEDNKLQNNIFLDTSYIDLLTRQSGNLSMDIDGDEIVEIPVPELMPGYAEAEQQDYAGTGQDNLYFTHWKVFEDGAFEEKDISYLNIGLGYSLSIPQNLVDHITAKRTEQERANNEIVFYYFEETLEQSEQELFRIRVANQGNTDDSLQEYRRIATSGQLSYFVRVEPLPEELIELQVDIDTLRDGLILLNEN